MKKNTPAPIDFKFRSGLDLTRIWATKKFVWMWVSYCDITILYCDITNVARKQLQGYVTIDWVDVVNTIWHHMCLFVNKPCGVTDLTHCGCWPIMGPQFCIFLMVNTDLRLCWGRLVMFFVKPQVTKYIDMPIIFYCFGFCYLISILAFNILWYINIGTSFNGSVSWLSVKL